MTREMGKVLAEARGDVQEGIDIAFLMAGEGRRMFGDTVPSELPDKWAMSIRQPIGVAGIITPWNFPMAIPCWKMMPALVTGNTVVFKPASRHAALRGAARRAACTRPGFPPGVVNLVTGVGEAVGDADRGRARTWRSSASRATATTGRAIAAKARRAAQAAVAWSSAARTASSCWPTRTWTSRWTGILWSAFGTTGQRCTACSRVIVQRAVADALRRAARGPDARRSGSGSGLDDDRRRRAAHQRRRRGQGRLATSTSGAARASWSSAAGGRPAATWRTATSSSRPIFARRRADGPDRPGGDLRPGPVGHPRWPTTRRPCSPLNQIRYGLSSSIYTRDVNTAFRAMRDFETGIVYVNAGTIGAETHLPVRRLEGDRQRPPRGGPRRARHVHRVEVDLRRLLRPAPARADRQPAELNREARGRRPGRRGLVVRAPRGARIDPIASQLPRASIPAISHDLGVTFGTAVEVIT